MNNEVMNVRLLKRQLRKEVQQTLKTLKNADIVEECLYYLMNLINSIANRCSRRLSQLPQFIQSRNVSIYLSMPSGELQTNSILEKAFQLGCINIKRTNRR